MTWPGAAARAASSRSRVIRRPVSAVRTRAGSTGRRARVRWSMTALRCLVSLNSEHSLALMGQGATQGPQVPGSSAAQRAMSHRRRLDLVLVDELGRAELTGHP